GESKLSRFAFSCGEPLEQFRVRALPNRTHAEERAYVAHGGIVPFTHHLAALGGSLNRLLLFIVPSRGGYSVFLPTPDEIPSERRPRARCPGSQVACGNAGPGRHQTPVPQPPRCLALPERPHTILLNTILNRVAAQKSFVYGKIDLASEGASG